MKPVNIFETQFDYDEADPPGYQGGMANVGRDAGGAALAVKLFELPPGKSLCPFHYEYVEEWLLVLEGDGVAVRLAQGTQQLARGDLVRFAPGPDGAHKVSNEGQDPARVLMFSSAHEPAVAVYPDSDKIGVWVPGGADNVMLRRPDGQVDYWDGEA